MWKCVLHFKQPFSVSITSKIKYLLTESAFPAAESSYPSVGIAVVSVSTSLAHYWQVSVVLQEQQQTHTSVPQKVNLTLQKMSNFSGSDTPSTLILLLFLNLPTQCCQKHLYFLPSPHTPLLSRSVSKTGPLSAYLSAPIISKLQSCSDFHFSCLTATPSCTVLSMESSAILPHLYNIPSSASFPSIHLYSLPLVYPLGNANSHLPFF